MTCSVLLLIPDKERQERIAKEHGFAAWSSVFNAVLEKRGWLSVEVRALDGIETTQELQRYDLIILAWHGSDPIGPDVQDWLLRSDTPVFFEGPLATLPEGIAVLGTPLLDAFPTDGPVIEITDCALIKEVSGLCPETLGGQAHRLKLEPKNIVSRPITYDFIGARHRVKECKDAPSAAAQAIVGLLQPLLNRFDRNGWLFEAVETDLQMAEALEKIQPMFVTGKHADRYCRFIERAVRAARSRQTIDVCEETNPRTEDPQERTRRVINRLAEEIESTLSEQDLLSPQAVIDAAGTTNLPNFLGALAKLRNTSLSDLADRTFLHLIEILYDADKGGLLNARISDGHLEASEIICNHPTLISALADFSGSIEVSHAGHVLSSKYTDLQRSIWDVPPLYFQQIEIGEKAGWKTVANLEPPHLPAILRQEQKIITTLPLLAWITHYHTVGPQSESFGDAAALGFMAIEEFVFLLLEVLAKHTRKPLPRVMPWPWGYKYALCVRHDVDRIPTARDFDRLMAFHQSLNLGVSWYWLPWRLDQEKIKRQHDAGHEIALHCVRALEKHFEVEKVQRADPEGDRIVGEAYHGTAADFWLGVSTVENSLETGFRYTEFAPNMFQFPYAAYPYLEPDGTVSTLEGCIGLTQNASADTSSMGQRKSKLVDNIGNVLEWVSRGHAIVLLNHPDLNFERLSEIVDTFPREGRLDWSARQIADWWDRTHRIKRLSVRWRSNKELELLAKEHINDLCLALTGPAPILSINGSPPTEDMTRIQPEGDVLVRLDLEANNPCVLSLE